MFKFSVCSDSALRSAHLRAFQLFHQVTVGTLAPPKKTQLQEKEESDLQNETAFTLEALVSNANYRFALG